MGAIDLLVASYLEDHHIERIRAADDRLRVLYDPDLIPPPRYAADHVGGPFERTKQQEAAWKAWLQRAEIMFDFDRSHQEELPVLAPNLKWIQATSAGIGQYVRRLDYHARMPQTKFTTASGVHAKPLSEFCMMAMLSFTRGLLRVVQDQQRQHWERYAGTDLYGRTLVIVGLGSIGTELARIATAFGMHVIGVKRNPHNVDPKSLHVRELYGADQLPVLLPRAEFLVLITPHTTETENLIGHQEIETLPHGSYLINIGRGQLLDEQALVDGLESGRVAGACLDVFQTEPLPVTSPLWDMPNVIVSPHSGATSDRENERIVDLFCENIQRYIAGEPLINLLDAELMY